MSRRDRWIFSSFAVTLLTLVLTVAAALLLTMVNNTLPWFDGRLESGIAAAERPVNAGVTIGVFLLFSLGLVIVSIGANVLDRKRGVRMPADKAKIWSPALRTRPILIRRQEG